MEQGRGLRSQRATVATFLLLLVLVVVQTLWTRFVRPSGGLGSAQGSEADSTK